MPFLLAASALLLAAGCVERRLIVRSDPPGATLYLDGEEIGPTPATVAFSHYGTRRVTLRLAGHITHESFYRTPIPWYQVFPIDFFTEVVWPGKLVDTHEIGPVTLRSNTVDDATAEELLERAALTRRSLAEPWSQASPEGSEPQQPSPEGSEPSSQPSPEPSDDGGED